LDSLNQDLLKKKSEVFDSPKMGRAAKIISQLMIGETSEYEEI